MDKSDKPGPETLLQLTFALAPNRVLAVGLQLGLFTEIAQGKKTAAAIAKACSASERGVRMLLDGACALGLLTKKAGNYELGLIASEYLVRGKPDYMGEFFANDSMFDSWKQLGDVVKSGKPLVRVEEKENAESFFPVLVRSLHVMNREPARRSAKVLGGKRVLDIACGSGVWGIAIAEANPEARVTANDFPRVLEVTREYVKKHGVEKRFDYLPGDLKSTDYGKGRFDVAILGNIVHSEGEKSSRALFKKLFDALEPGGRLAIVEMVPSDDRTGPPFPVLFALNMLLHSETGDTYTLAELTSWLKEAGFEKVETHDIGSHSPLVVGIKK
jgi:ubiquinone/menaquinone biosynthesis C-methylase UbiE